MTLGLARAPAMGALSIGAAVKICTELMGSARHGALQSTRSSGGLAAENDNHRMQHF